MCFLLRNTACVNQTFVDIYQRNSSTEPISTAMFFDQGLAVFVRVKPAVSSFRPCQTSRRQQFSYVMGKLEQFWSCRSLSISRWLHMYDTIVRLKSALWGGCLQLWALPTITCTYSPKVQHSVQRHIIVRSSPVFGGNVSLWLCAHVAPFRSLFLAPLFRHWAQSSITFARTTTHIIVLLVLNYVTCQMPLPQIPSYNTPN